MPAGCGSNATAVLASGFGTRKKRARFASELWGVVVCVHEAHRNSGDLANDLGLTGKRELLDGTGRQRMGKQRELVALNLAPSARVAVAKLQEIDRPVEFGSPGGGVHLSHALIDLHKRSRS